MNECLFSGLDGTVFSALSWRFHRRHFRNVVERQRRRPPPTQPNFLHSSFSLQQKGNRRCKSALPPRRPIFPQLTKKKTQKKPRKAQNNFLKKKKKKKKNKKKPKKPKKNSQKKKKKKKKK